MPKTIQLNAIPAAEMIKSPRLPDRSTKHGVMNDDKSMTNPIMIVATAESIELDAFINIVSL